MTGRMSPLDLGTKKIEDSKGPDLVSLIMLDSNMRDMVVSRQGLTRLSLFIRNESVLIKTRTPSFHFLYMFPNGKTELNRRTVEM
jgi:hypothetical protein